MKTISALDTWSRFCRMYAATVLGIPRDMLGDNLQRDADIAVLRADIGRDAEHLRSRGNSNPR